MSLLTYQGRAPLGQVDRQRVVDRLMPPWHADPAHGEFLERSPPLRRREGHDSARGSTAGAPEGNPQDLPAAADVHRGLDDRTARRRADDAGGLSDSGEGRRSHISTSRCRATSPKTWIQAYEVRPGNRAVRAPRDRLRAPAAPPRRRRRAAASAAAAAAAAARPHVRGRHGDSRRADRRAAAAGGQRKPLGPNDRPAPQVLGPSVGGYVPGNATRVYVPAPPCKLAAGSTLDLPDALHDDRHGDDRSDEHRVDLCQGTAEGRRCVVTALVNGALHIPAGDAEAPRGRRDDDQPRHHAVEHAAAHARARQALEYEAIYPRWPHRDAARGAQLRLRVADRLHLQAAAEAAEGHRASTPSRGTTTRPANKSNPDPTKDVWWGDQTFEEMMFTGRVAQHRPGAGRARRRSAVTERDLPGRARSVQHECGRGAHRFPASALLCGAQSLNGCLPSASLIRSAGQNLGGRATAAPNATRGRNGTVVVDNQNSSRASWRCPARRLPARSAARGDG